MALRLTVGLVLCHSELVLQISLVADNDDRRILILHLVDALNPITHRLERL